MLPRNEAPDMTAVESSLSTYCYVRLKLHCAYVNQPKAPVANKVTTWLALAIFV